MTLPSPGRLSRHEAGRLASQLLDDVLRHGERAEGSGVSSATVAVALGLSESRVRKLRDPHEEATLSLRDLLMLPDSVARPLLAAVLAARRELHGEPAAPITAEDQAHVLIATQGRALAELGAALVDGVITPEEGARLRGVLRALLRDGERLLTRLPGNEP